MRNTVMPRASEEQQQRHAKYRQQQRLRRRRRGSSSVVGAAVLATVLAALLAFGLQGCDAQANSSTPGPNDAGATTAPPGTPSPRPATPPPLPPATTPPPPATAAPPVTTPPPPPVTTTPPPPPPVTTAPPAVTTAPPPAVTTRPPVPATTPPPPATATPAPTAAPTQPPTTPPPSTVTPQPTASPSPSSSAPASPTTPGPLIEITSAILPSVTTAPPSIDADTSSTSSGRTGGSVTLAIIVAAVVGTVFAGAVFVYVKTSRRQEAIKREFDSERQLPTTATAAAGSGQYAQLSPAQQPNAGYDAYAGSGGGSGGTIGPPPPSAKPKKSTEADSLCEPIDLNDPNFDVLTPLSDIAMAGGGLTDSFRGQSSGYYSSETPSEGTVRSGTSSSATGSVFYDPNGAMSELYPTDVPVQRQNSVSGDSDSDDDSDAGARSFDSQSTFDMPSVSEWNASDTRSRAESAAFSIGSEMSITDDLPAPPVRPHQPHGQPYQDSDVSSGLHDPDASVSSYSEYDRPTATTSLSTYSEYRISDTARFDSHVFSDVDGATAIPIDSDDIDDDGGYDDSSYLGNSYASDVTPLSDADIMSSFIDSERMSDSSDTRRGSYSSASSSSDGDDLDRDSGGYSFDDNEEIEDFINGGSDSFSSTSSYEV